MRQLNMEEIISVSGGGDTCDSSYVGEQSSFFDDFVDLYEGFISATVYIMERIDDVLE